MKQQRSTMQHVRTGCNWNTNPAPTACYETATFNDATCTWDVTGTQDPAQPHVSMKQQRLTMQHDAGCNWNLEPTVTANSNVRVRCT
jgi:hypothetical protein